MKKLSFMLALAVLTFGFIVTVTSCHNSLTGTDPQSLSASSNTTKSINVYFNVKNGGWGLTESSGKVKTKDGSYYSFNGKDWASNFSISLVIPSEETYVKVYWQGRQFLGGWTYLSARLNLIPEVSDYNILINYNGKGKVVTDGLADVSVWK